MDAETVRALNDLTNNVQAQLTTVTEGWGKAMEEYNGVLEKIFEDIAGKIVLLDEALLHITTRLDQIEGVMGLDSLNKYTDTTTAEDLPNG